MPVAPDALVSRTNCLWVCKYRSRRRSEGNDCGRREGKGTRKGAAEADLHFPNLNAATGEREEPELEERWEGKFEEATSARRVRAPRGREGTGAGGSRATPPPLPCRSDVRHRLDGIQADPAFPPS